jgi:hypothetical protein
MCAETETKKQCSKIISRSADGKNNYIIEHNTRVWITEEGKKLIECEPQYSGPVWNIKGDAACLGYKGPVGGLFF